MILNCLGECGATVGGTNMKFLITGANGFVGRALGVELSRRGYAVRSAVRSVAGPDEGIDQVAIGNIDGATDWSEALRGVEVVVHLAARVHVMRDTETDPLVAFRRVNVEGTANLARQAAEAGVKRLVYVSSVKVNGESTCPVDSSDLLEIPPSPPFLKGGIGSPYAKGKAGRTAFTETDVANPQDPYGISKWEAEQALHRVAQETGLEVVIVRPPLVYGAGVKGNFAQLIRVLKKSIPLPLASVRNLRSLVYVGNLVDALVLCATHPAAAGQTYLVSDGEDVSTPDLLRRLGAAMGHPARLFPCPPALLKLAGRLTGNSDQVERLLGSLQVDSGKIRRELGWTPPFTLEQGLQATADWHRSVNSLTK
jgi:nucleoside-diphosphate-sugar epimerase